MHSSTSNSKRQLYVRPLPVIKGYKKILALTVVWTAIGIGGVEYYARANSFPVMFEISPDLWVTQWYKTERGPEDQTVIIGASRCKFGLVMDTWEQATEVRPTMLAWPGSPPHPTLHLLAERDDFRGLVICGIAPSFSFSHAAAPQHLYLKKNIEEMKVLRYSLSYHLGTPVRRFLKHQIRALNPPAFAPAHVLREIVGLQDRHGTLPPFLPIYWMNHQENLQSVYLDFSAKDEELMNRVKALWSRIIEEQTVFGVADMDSLLAAYVQDVQRIRQRGGQVVFIRHPSSGDFREFEEKYYPREKFFDRLCAETNCLGIHFEDYPEIADFECPEWSHLNSEDARSYTRRIIQILSSHQVKLKP